MINLDFTSNFTPFVAGAIKAGIIAVIALIIMLAIKKLVPKIICTRIPKIREESPDQLASRSKTLSQVIVQFATVIIWIIAGIMILSVVGVNITPILATVGVASLAIGLAAQNIIRDYLHGFFIIMEDWYRIGEVANVAGIGGLVENISLRRTILRDLNGTMHVIPNGKIELASNMTRDWSRVNLNISVSYNENLSKVFSVINEVGKEMKEDPVFGQDLLTAPHAERVDNLGDSGIEIKILADTKPIKQWGLMGELRKKLKDRFDQEGIEIPWPHTKVYFGNTPTGIGKN
ncbi:MAG: mechanosensitive ion channel family protein [Dehalococcoidales bacterium]|nr:mechanosensitive ion channel family protein [Dehalococcoidales bacterium]